MTKDSPDTLELLKSLLLPGKDVICNYASGIREDAEKTDWLKAVYRIESMSLLLFVSAVLMGVFLFFDPRYLLMNLIKIAGVHMVIAGVVLLALILPRTVLLAVGAINEGDSVIHLLTGGRGPLSPIRFVMGFVSLALSVSVFSFSGVGFEQVLVFSVFVFLFLGALGFAVSGVISLAFS